jgi:tetratricopeptide (TPR) repeat protein
MPLRRTLESTESASRRSELGLALVPPIAAFAIFLIYLSQIRGQPFFKYLVANPLVYDSEARLLIQGVPSGQPFFLSAIYPAFVALFDWLHRGNSTALALAQGVLLALNVWLTGRIARRFFSRWTALGASAIAACYWSFYYFAGELVPVTLFAFFMLSGTLLVLDRGRRKPSPLGSATIAFAGLLLFLFTVPALRHLAGILRGMPLARPANQYAAGVALFAVFAAGALGLLLGLGQWARTGALRNAASGGLALGVAVLAWSGGAVLAALLAVWLVTMREKARALVLVLGLLVPVLASTAHNLIVSGDFIPVTSSFGVNFFIGNNPASDGMDPFRLGKDNGVRIEADRLGLSGKARSDFFAGQAERFIRDDPGQWLGLEGSKVLIWINRARVNNNADIGERRSAWRHLFLPVLSFGAIFPLACAGAVAAARANRRALILGAAWLSFMAVPLVFFSCERFRLPSIAFLIPLAACAVEATIRHARAREFGPLALMIAIGAGAAAVSYPDLPGISRSDMPSIIANKAYVERMAGDYGAAEKYAREALRLDPGNAGALFQLGAIDEHDGNTDAAFGYYLDALEADPFFSAAYSAAADMLDARRINRAYLDAYLDGLVRGGGPYDKQDLIRFFGGRSP